MKKLPLNIQTFETLINENYVYVDKTKHIYELITNGRYYLLARPRRFGKSLLVSTLRNLFEGNKKLFANLLISKTVYSWPKHPVVHLDFSNIDHRTPEELENNIAMQLEAIALNHNINISLAPSVKSKLVLLVKKLSQINKVVILIDEYDYPILKHLPNLEIAKEQRAVLSSFYTVIKGLDEYIRFVLLVGVSKVSITSIFGGLNNLNDISYNSQSAALLGCTTEELEYFFKDRLEDISHQQNINYNELLSEISRWYNGYRFSHENIEVYNPGSVLLYLNSDISANRFENEAPSFLDDILKNNYKSLDILKYITEPCFSINSLGTFDIDNIPLIAILFQTGYLTIKKYAPETDKFSLGYPNEQAKNSFEKLLTSSKSNAMFQST